MCIDLELSPHCSHFLCTITNAINTASLIYAKNVLVLSEFHAQFISEV